MIGLNGGLIGRTRIYDPGGPSTASGFWTLTEILARRRVFYAIGGTLSQVVDTGIVYRVHIFSTVGTFTLQALTTGTAECLVIGGGGGGSGGLASVGGGGGGAGGYLYNPSLELVQGVTYDITVGAGGAAGGDQGPGGFGSNSSIVGTGVSVISIGGGNGVIFPPSGSGGSGGGISGTGLSGSYVTTPGAGTAGQGNRGGRGTGVLGSSATTGGGGGGASATPADGATTGGAGLVSNITGSSVTYSKGGNGGFTGATPAAGAANTGNGGDGKREVGLGAQAGGSGIVVIRYPT
jgi:hypothetical protein